MALTLVLIAPLGTIGFRRLCAAPLDTFPVLAAARDEAAATAARAPPGSAGDLARVKAATLRRLVDLKQSDAVAFPLHVVAGAALSAGGCSGTVVGDQWRKAAEHASAEWMARLAAGGLQRTVVPALGHDSTLALLDQLADDAPWYTANLARVRRHLEYS